MTEQKRYIAISTRPRPFDVLRKVKSQSVLLCFRQEDIKFKSVAVRISLSPN